ncbi:MAG: hypothetical protein HKL90_09235 [Elusimicrobia bacterium]|nr:hypothetical protein [Elusimicrobiota bacterium]
MIDRTRADLPNSAGLTALVCAVAFLGAAGCATGPSASSKQVVNAYIASHQYAQAEAYLDANRDSQYGASNAVLFYLDKGAVQSFAGEYKQSDATLDLAEQRMDQLYTVSLSRAGGMLLINDNTAEYAGEPYERSMLNVFRALDYVFLGDHEDALVESRKLERFLQELNDTTGGKGVYKDDAFAHYLNALLFADSGQMDDARISLRASDAAYRDYVSLYGTPVPHFDFPKRSKKNGELVFIHYNGIAPRKISRTYQIAWNEAAMIARQDDSTDQQTRNAIMGGLMGNAITVAFPEFVQDPYRIVSSEVWIDSRPAATTQLMEDVTAIAARGLQNRVGMIRARAIARATVKYVLATIAARAAAAACDRQFGSGSWQDLLCKAGTSAVSYGLAAGTEAADVRCWGALPAQFRMARVKVQAGKHDVELLFKDSAGVVVSSQTFSGIDIAPRRRTYIAWRTAQ